MNFSENFARNSVMNSVVSAISSIKIPEKTKSKVKIIRLAILKNSLIGRRSVITRIGD